ncbi:MAG: hypothetical protein H0T76_18500 [Nannocystis sp.]|nr:hypothetical protein [Nannocystis sp.]
MIAPTPAPTPVVVEPESLPEPAPTTAVAAPVVEPEPEPMPTTAVPIVEPEPVPVVVAPVPVVEEPSKKPEAKKPPREPSEPAEQVNYDIEDDPQAPTEVSGAQIDDLLRPLRPAASECGKKHGVALGTDIGVKMILAPDGRLTSVRPTDRPLEDPAVQCILGLVKSVRLEKAGQARFTSALFDYSFKVY